MFINDFLWIKTEEKQGNWTLSTLIDFIFNGIVGVYLNIGISKMNKVSLLKITKQKKYIFFMETDISEKIHREYQIL